MTKILALLFTFISFNCLSYDKLITYADFVTMPKEKQYQTISLIHDFLTEVEKQQNWHLRKKPRYQSYLKILNLFMSEAAASDALFTAVDSQHKCYYGGWISFIRKTADGRSLCVHPKKILYPDNLAYLAKIAAAQPYNEKTFKNSSIHKFFVENIATKYNEVANSKKNSLISYNEQDKKIDYKDSDKSCSSESSLPCNPEIYGTKGGSTFCISSIADRGLNASYLCQRALEELPTDEKKQAMEEIVQNGISGNSNLLSGLKTMYDTCLCKGNADRQNSEYTGSINSEYSSKIFSSRTCAGILNQTQTIKETFLSSCQGEDFTGDSNLKRWKNYLERLDDVLNENLKNISNQHSQLSGLHLRSISSQAVDKYFKEDAAIFEKIANENYQIAKENNLCPVLDEISSLTLNYNQETKQLEVELVNADEKDKAQLSDVNINHTQIENEVASSEKIDTPQVDESDQKDDAGKYIHTFNVKTVADDSNAQATATLDGKPLTSNMVIIPGIEQQKILATCSISVKGDTVTLVPILKKGEEVLKLKSEDVQDLKLPFESENISKDGFQYTVAEIDKIPSLEVTGKIKSNDKEYPFTCSHKNKAEVKEKTIASCEMTIEKKVDKAGLTSLIPNITFINEDGTKTVIGYNTEDEEITVTATDKDGKELPDTPKEYPSYELTWFSLDVPKQELAEKDPEQSANADIIDEKENESTDAEEGADEPNEEPKKKKDKKSKYAEKFYNMSPKDENGEFQATKAPMSGIPQTMKEQKFAATLRFEESCDAAAEVTIPGFNSSGGNGNPQLQNNRPGNIVTPGGSIRGGMR